MERKPSVNDLGRPAGRYFTFLITVVTGMVLWFFMFSPVLAEYQQAIIYYGRGMYEKAIQEIKPEVEAHPNDWEPGHRILGLCYVKTKKYPQAIAALSKAVQLKSPVFSTYMGLAIAYWESNQASRVAGVLTEGERLAKSNDERYELFHWRGSANYRQKQYAAAIKDLTEALRLRQGDVSDYSQLGLAHYYANHYDDAITTLTKALSMKAGDTSLQEALTRSYQKRGAAHLKDKHYARAVEDLSKAISYNSKDGSTYYNLGLSQLFLNQYDQAESSFTRAAELLSGNADPYQQLGYVYEKRKQYDKALDAYKKAYGLNKSPGLKASIARVNQISGEK
ncbi:MAG: tetratricopeptide repeat protein [Acidobacteria bacterium]|nr:tetratricopeptide repeat protein [Acidobacteriota bacterium]MBI3658113.1 tetratricopeptide repeat protein [Acidobacteriota bacterium]